MRSRQYKKEVATPENDMDTPKAGKTGRAAGPHHPGSQRRSSMPFCGKPKNMADETMKNFHKFGRKTRGSSRRGKRTPGTAQTHRIRQNKDDRRKLRAQSAETKETLTNRPISNSVNAVKVLSMNLKGTVSSRSGFQGLPVCTDGNSSVPKSTFPIWN